MVVRRLEWLLIWAAIFTVCFAIYNVALRALGELILSVIGAIGG